MHKKGNVTDMEQWMNSSIPHRTGCQATDADNGLRLVPRLSSAPRQDFDAIFTARSRHPSATVARHLHITSGIHGGAPGVKGRGKMTSRCRNTFTLKGNDEAKVEQIEMRLLCPFKA